MKRMIAWILAAMLLMSLCACSGEKPQTGATGQTSETQDVQQGNSEETSGEEMTPAQTVTVDAVKAAPETSPEQFDYDTEEDGVVIIEYTGNGGIVAVPASIDGVNVVEIDDKAFVNCDNVTAVRIPDGVQKIGDHVFENCTGLQIFISGKSVKSIGEYAFNSCRSLMTVELNEGLEELETLCFGGSGLKELEVPSTVNKVVAAFRGKSSEDPFVIIGEAGSYIDTYVQENGESRCLEFRQK